MRRKLLIALAWTVFTGVNGLMALPPGALGHNLFGLAVDAARCQVYMHCPPIDGLAQRPR